MSDLASKTTATRSVIYRNEFGTFCASVAMSLADACGMADSLTQTGATDVEIVPAEAWEAYKADK